MAECIVYGSILPDGGWDISNTLALVSIIVDIVFGVIVVAVISNRISCDREFRNYFIKEVCEEKQKHEFFWHEFENSKMTLPSVISWFKQRNIATTALMRTYRKRKKKASYQFEIYVHKMRAFIDETDWMQKPQRNGHHKISKPDIDRIVLFKRKNASIFHDIISEING